MKFIFPQNYKLNAKILGIIDYTTAIVDVILAGLIWIMISIFTENFSVKIFIFIILAVPIVIFSIIGINGENIIYVSKYMLKYIFSQKIFIYDKNIDCKK